MKKQIKNKNKMKQNIFQLIILALLCPYSLSGQMIEVPKNIQSPNAASLGKYGDLPVSLYTGSPVISIPLHSMNEGGVPLDIVLNYDASGVRVNDVPGWVGQNWSLSCGGVITRTVKGTCPDEMDWKNSNVSNPTTPGYYYKYNTLNTSNWSTESNLKQIVENSLNSSSFQNYEQDLEPDIFTFNFMGMTGKFFLSQDGKWKVQSGSNLKVEINMADNVYPMGFEKIGRDVNGWKYPKVIGKIKITDDKGNTYIFGGNQDAIEYSFPDFFHQTYYSQGYSITANPIIANAWYLTEVRDKYNNVLYSLSYTRGDYQARLYLASGVTEYKKENGDYLDPSCKSAIIENGRPISVAGQLIAPSYLDEIQSASGEKIDFNSSVHSYEPLKYQLNGLLNTQLLLDYSNLRGGEYVSAFQDNFWYVIHSKDGNTQLYTPTSIEKDDFNYILNKLQWRWLQAIDIYQNDLYQNDIVFSYNNNNTNPNKRLFLDSLYISQGNKKYKFDYYKKDNMPYFLSDSVDLMGYYRGDKFDNYTNSADFPNHAATRTSNGEYAQRGILKRITYPTGGFSDFEYELHDYSQKVCNEATNFKSLINASGIISGLRIKQIIDNDINGKFKVKNYFYKQSLTSNVSSGILLFEPIFFYPKWSGKTLDGANYYERVFNINPILPMSNFSGTHIEYSNVIELIGGNGYTEYKYYNYNDTPDVGYAGTLCVNHSPFDAYTDFSFKRGKVKEQSVYSGSNTLLERKSYQYQSNNNLKVRSFNYTTIQPCLPSTIIVGNAYEIYYADNLLAQETDEKFFNGTAVSTTTKYAYKTDNTQTDNFGDMYLDSIKTDFGTIKEYSIFKYPFDNTSNTMMASLASKRINPVVSNLIQRNINGTNTMQNISERKVEYQNFTINNSTIPMPCEEWSRTGNNDFQKYLTILNYNSKNGNILSYSKNDNVVYNVVWSYKNKYPVAIIENSPFEYVNSLINTVESFGDKTTLTQSDIDKFNNLRTSALSSANVTTYTYKPLVGMLSATDPSGKTVSYEYDDFDRLKCVKDHAGKIIESYDYHYQNGTKTYPDMYNVYLTNNSGNSSYVYQVYIDGVAYNFPPNGIVNILTTTLSPGTHVFSFPCGPGPSDYFINNIAVTISCNGPHHTNVNSDIYIRFHQATPVSCNLATGTTPPSGFCCFGCQYTTTVYLVGGLYCYDREGLQPIQEKLIFRYDTATISVLDGRGKPTGATVNCP